MRNKVRCEAMVCSLIATCGSPNMPWQAAAMLCSLRWCSQQPGLWKSVETGAGCRFMCSFVPDKRPAWAEAWSRLIRPGGELITLIFPVGLGTSSSASAEVLCAIPGYEQYCPCHTRKQSQSVSLSSNDGQPSRWPALATVQSCMVVLGVGLKDATISQQAALTCIQFLLEGCRQRPPSLSACQLNTAPPFYQS